MSLFAELRRRNVFRVAIAYIVTAWLVLQVADVILGNIGAPTWIFQSLLLIIALGLPLALILAWAFEVTPEGIKREQDVARDESITQLTGRRLDFAIIGVLALALAYFVGERVMRDEIPVEPLSAGTTAESGARSIAVLPFVNMSPDPDQEFFSDGISEELLNVLAQYPRLRVAARTSSFQFKGQNRDIGEIAELLNVNHVLEGSVRKAGTRLRITAQLIKADDGFHVWSATYDRELDDVFAIQNDIARSIGEALVATLEVPTSNQRPTVIASANTEAYEAYLRGRGLIHQRGRAALEQAVAELEKSLRLDGSFAPAHASLAIAYSLLLDSVATYGELTLADVNRRALPHVQRALELEPELADAHAAFALLELNNDRPKATIEHGGRALEINPSLSDVYTWMSIANVDLGNVDEAQRLAIAALEVDPMSVIGRANITANHIRRYRLDEALEHSERLLQQSPWFGYRTRANIMSARGDLSETIRWLLLAYRENPNDALSNSELVYTFLDLDLHAEARRITSREAHWVDLETDNIDRAIDTITRRRELDPDNSDLLNEAAALLYTARRFDAAHELAEQVYARARARDKQMFPGQLLRIADLRRRVGDLLGAEAMAQTAVARFEELSSSGRDDSTRHLDFASLHVYNGAQDEAIEALTFAIEERGFRGKLLDPLFDPLRDDVRFQELEARIAELNASDRQETLQLICFDNPVPDAWQPLPETCADIRQQSAHRLQERLSPKAST